MTSDNFTFEDFTRFQNVPRETFDRLKCYVELLKKWQKTINLISDGTLETIWERHIVDSAQLINYISQEDTVADLGSGGGFPGLVLAMLGAKKMTLIESDTRKCAFLREAARVSGLSNISIINQRIETCSLSEFSIITARAFAPINNLLNLLAKTLTSSHKLLLLKGKNYAAEIKEAQAAWHFDHTVLPGTSERSTILLLQNCIYQGAPT